jgi:hypothetical protein
VYLVSAVVGGFAAWRYGANDMTPASFATGVSVVGLAVLMLLALGILFSVIFNNTVMAVATLMLVWYVASSIFGFLGAEYLSPFALSRNLPRMLKDPNAVQLLDGEATLTGINLSFSKPIDARSAEQPGNYSINSTDGASFVPQTAVYDGPTHSVVLAGLTLPPGAKLSVTARNVTDEGGAAISQAANSVDIKVPSDSVSSNAPMTGEHNINGIVGSGTTGVPKPANSTLNSSSMTEIRGSVIHAAPHVLQCISTSGSVKVTFSTALNAKDAEDVENYIVECPQGKIWPARAATYSPAAHTVLLSGFSFNSDDPVKVTVKHVRSADGVSISTGNNSATYAALTTWKYVIGLGAPSLLAFMLAMAWFARRDL